MKKIIILLLIAGSALIAQQPANPQWILASGISFDAFGQQGSNVNTAAFKIAEINGLPTYQQTTLETALFTITAGKIVAAPQTATTVRAGVCQVAYQTASKLVTLGGCADLGITKAGDAATLGSPSGAGFLTWDVGSWLSKGKFHAFIIPTYRIIAVAGTQVKASYALRIGTGF